MSVRDPWMIQVDFEDKSLTSCPLHVFRRELKGTGIEVDASYAPTHVGRGRFIGRGFATARAIKKLTQRIYIAGRELRHGNVHPFKELKFEDAIKDRPDQPIMQTWVTM